MSDKEIFTAEEAAAMMGCSEYTIEEHARNRVLPGLRLGHEWRFPRAAFMQAINDLARSGELHRRSEKRDVQATVTQPPKASRRRTVPVLPTLRSND